MCFATIDPKNSEVARQQRGRGQVRQQQRQVISDEIRATLVHHVLIHGTASATQPNFLFSLHTSIVCTFRRETDHLPCCYYDTCNVVVRID